jgi:glutathionylspermidine synthase
MERIACAPRPDWEKKVESVGLTFHHTLQPDGSRSVYWEESAFYRFTAAEIDALEAATNTLQEMCLAAAQHVIDTKRYADLAIPSEAVRAIEWSWEAEPPAVYGRIDLAFDGIGPPKLLEYNADTPTALLEAAVVQWYWLEDLYPNQDQFNSIHERLVGKWKELRDYLTGSIVYFCHANNLDTEDLMTANYMRDTAAQAGLATVPMLVDEIGWNQKRQCFVDPSELAMQTIFKLYPWEWLVSEQFGPFLLQTYQNVQWIEPIWKMLLSNKGILPILWELYPNHPNLLPAYFDNPHGLEEYAMKPLLGRQGENITLFTKQGKIAAPGEYGKEGYVYQQYRPLPEFDGKYACVGSWLIDGESAGIGIRESETLITDNFSRFIPHYFEK